MTLKIKWFNREASREEGQPWESQDRSFKNLLNLIAVPEKVYGYYPDIQEGLIKLVQEEFKGVEILEHTTKKVTYPKDAIF